MPSVNTHHLVARETLQRLPAALQNRIKPYLSVYFYGAQGADFCFFYKFIRPRRRNLGSYLHRKGGYDAFSVLKSFSARDDFALTYALGYVTHYAADTLFHPHVYAAAGKSLLLHSRIEGALDVLFTSVFSHAKTRYARPDLSEMDIHELFLIYAAITAKTDFPPLIKSSFVNAVKLFNAYLPVSFSLFGEKRPRLLAAVFGKENPQKTAVGIFRNAVEQSLLLIDEFLQAVNENAPLPRPLFGKNYLSGK